MDAQDPREGSGGGRRIRSWDTRKLEGETEAEYLLRMFLVDLQMLAAEPAVLIRAFYPPGPAGREMSNIAAENVAENLDSFLEFHSDKVVAAGLVTQDMLEKARQLDMKLAEMSGPQDPDLWTDGALRTRTEWYFIRHLARDAIEALGYNVEEPPPWSRWVKKAR